ncbi:MAG: MBL fold metallo-hydrolase [Pseudomonadota bacterium]
MLNEANAGKVEDETIDKVVNAYGGAKFANLKSITIHSDLRFGGVEQGYTAGYVELLPRKKILKIDLINKRGSMEIWGGPLNPYNMRNLSVDSGTAIVWYDKMEYRLEPRGTFYSQFGGEIRTSDTLLAYELMTRPDAASYKGKVTYVGIAHDVVELAIPDWPLMDLYINSGTGHITKMVRETDDGALNYQYGDFKTNNGITYANDFEFYFENFLSEYAKSREIEVDTVRANVFEIDRGLREEGEAVDQSQMSVDAVGNHVHQVGRTGAYSAFIEAEDYLIAVGGSAGLKNRYEAYKARLSLDTKPLRYVIVTHHHGDHLAGMREASELGVTFISPSMAVERLKHHGGDGLTDSDIKVLDQKMTLGPVEIYDIVTAHVGSYALVYVPEDKTVFQVDHYGGYYRDGPSAANWSAATLKAEIDRLGLDVDIILSGHHRKAESYDMFLTSLASYYRSGPCPTQRAICR